MLVGSCQKCGAPATLRCAFCGRTFCRNCLDQDERLCAECRVLRKGAHGPEGARLPPSRKMLARPPPVALPVPAAAPQEAGADEHEPDGERQAAPPSQAKPRGARRRVAAVRDRR